MQGLNAPHPHLKEVKLASSTAILRKLYGIKCDREGARLRLHGNPYFADDEEVSPHFEGLKNRDYLITQAETMDVKKAEVLKRLKRAVEKLKEARKEIHEALLAAMKMNEDGDDIADYVMAAVAVLSSEN